MLLMQWPLTHLVQILSATMIIQQQVKDLDLFILIILML